jgi:hypothetical protein
LVWVKDEEGNEFIYHLRQLKDLQEVSKEEPTQTVDSDSVA